MRNVSLICMKIIEAPGRLQTRIDAELRHAFLGINVYEGGAWRRGRDSNPRYPCEYAAFRVRCFQPLSHLSGARNGSEKPPNGRPLCNQACQDRQGRTAYIAPSSMDQATARRSNEESAEIRPQPQGYAR